MIITSICLLDLVKRKLQGKSLVNIENLGKETSQVHTMDTLVITKHEGSRFGSWPNIQQGLLIETQSLKIGILCLMVTFI